MPRDSRAALAISTPVFAALGDAQRPRLVASRPSSLARDVRHGRDDVSECGVDGSSRGMAALEPMDACSIIAGLILVAVVGPIADRAALAASADRVGRRGRHGPDGDVADPESFADMYVRAPRLELHVRQRQSSARRGVRSSVRAETKRGSRRPSATSVRRVTDTEARRRSRCAGASVTPAGARRPAG